MPLHSEVSNIRNSTIKNGESNRDNQNLLNFLFELISDAKSLLAPHSFNRITFKEKEKGSWVTETDLAIEQSWINSIFKKYPHSIIWGEETGKHLSKTPQSAEAPMTWYLDPIDGTSNFVQRIPFYCNAIGVFKNDQAIASMIHIPALQESYWALAGEGAFCNNRLIKSSITSDWDKTVVVHSPKLLLTQYDQYPWQKKLQKLHTRRIFGSAAIELAYVASGHLDACFHQNLQPWDVACAFCLLQESGGKIFNFEVLPAIPDGKNFIALNQSLSLA